MTQPRIGIYPGTFDPITNGHADIIRRAVRIVDRLVIGVARNDGKGPLFATDERVEIVRDEVAHLENGDAERIEVRAFDTLLVNFAQSGFVKEIGALGGDVSHFVSPRVAIRLLDRFANGRGRPRRRIAAAD
jgi:pantetheine-phosphate adenylyltransferase